MNGKTPSLTPSSSSESLGALSSASSYVAPLAGDYDASIDGTSVAGGEALEGPSSLSQVSEESKSSALSLKSEANALFSQSRYTEALDRYSWSIRLNPFDPAVFSNRAAVRLKREEHGLAIHDATKAIELDSAYTKAWYRRAVAQLAIMQPKGAANDLKKVLQLDPKNAMARQQLDSTLKLIKRLEFEKAIASKDDPLVTDRAREMLKEGLEVEKTYQGPRIPESGITQTFVDEMIIWFKQGKLIHRRYAWEIVIGCFDELLKHESLVEVQIPEGATLDVIGDTHGQYFDLCHLLSLTGMPTRQHFMLFNGDFVDRGSWSTEVVLVLFALKWLHPNTVFLNRGNHETADMNKVYGFEGETKHKYSALTYSLFEEVFAALPLATLVSASQSPRRAIKRDLRMPINPTLGPEGRKRYFVVHGGLYSRDDVTLETIRKIDRKRVKQPAGDTTMGECLWADPQDAPGRGPSKRGVGVGFGPDISRKWTEANKVTAVLRSHEVQQDGYLIHHDGLVITVFSAPNYVDSVGNKASFCRIDDSGELSFTCFEAQPHPPIRPMAYSGGFGGLIG